MIKIKISNVANEIHARVTIPNLNESESNHCVVNTADVIREMSEQGHDVTGHTCIINPTQLDNRRPSRLAAIWSFAKPAVKTPTIEQPPTIIKKDEGEEARKFTTKKARTRKTKK
jgi:hypothetical protein